MHTKGPIRNASYEGPFGRSFVLASQSSPGDLAHKPILLYLHVIIYSILEFLLVVRKFISNLFSHIPCGVFFTICVDIFSWRKTGYFRVDFCLRSMPRSNSVNLSLSFSRNIHITIICDGLLADN